MWITKETKITELIDYDKEHGTMLATIMMGTGMKCLTCHLVETETLEEACQAHDMDCDALMRALNEYLVRNTGSEG